MKASGADRVGGLRTMFSRGGGAHAANANSSPNKTTDCKRGKLFSLRERSGENIHIADRDAESGNLLQTALAFKRLDAPVAVEVDAVEQRRRKASRFGKLGLNGADVLDREELAFD